MSVKSNITDKASNLSANVVHKEECDCQALAVATVPYRTFENSLKFFTNPNNGADMNVDASAGGTPVKIHDGTDSVLWTGTQPVGGADVIFDSTDVNHTPAGTKSVEFDKCEVDDVAQFAKGSSQALSGYVSLSLWIYVDKNWNTGDSFSIYGYDTGTTAVKGVPVKLENYFSPQDNDIWQEIIIPLEDMELTTETIDAIRIKCDAVDGKLAEFYIDDIQLEETGTPVRYTVKPDKDTWLIVKEFTISMADAYTGTLADGTMPNIPYDSFLGLTSTVGINYQRIQNGEVKFSATIKNLLGFLELSGTELVSYGSDGTNTWLTVRVQHMEPFVLKAEDADELRFTISEDFSSLLKFRINAGCKVEQR